MELETQLTFRHLEYSASVARAVRRRAERLERFCSRIIGCRVMIEPSAHRHRQGNLYHIRVDLTVPGAELVVRRDPPERHAHENIYVAIRDAFDSAQRALEDYARQRLRRKPAHKARRLTRADKFRRAAG